MHFIGMLAFSLPCGVAYEPFQTALSMIPGVLASGVALSVISRPNPSQTKLAFGAHQQGAERQLGLAGIGTADHRERHA